MVKGISRQVIVVHAPDPKMFEQAIFILKDSAVEGNGVTDEALLQEAKKLLRSETGGRGKKSMSGPLWAFGGATITAMIWLLSCLI